MTMRKLYQVALVTAITVAIFYFRTLLVFGESSVIEACLATPYLHAWDCPYSLLWYGMAELIPHATFQGWANGIAIIDALVMVFVYRFLGFRAFCAYSACSFSAFLAPYNMMIIWLTLLGFVSAWTLWIPIVAKLPFGSNLFVGWTEWKFIFSSSLQHPYAYVWYSVIGMWWLLVLFKGKWAKL